MLELIRNGSELDFRKRLRLVAMLSWPAIVAQFSSIAMQYIDAAMVGRLSAADSASVGLMSSSLWLFWGVCSAMTVGFTVQVAHRIGASDRNGAVAVFRQSIICSLIFGIIIAAVGIAIAGRLPEMLGGDASICGGASLYFSVFVAALPILTMNYLGCGMLRCVGNMRAAGAISVAMCVLDVVFNWFLIFPDRTLAIGSFTMTVPGADLGILGAALGTVAAEAVSASLAMWWVWHREPQLSPQPGSKGGFRPTAAVVRNAFRISAPMSLEHAVICGAQIAVTTIVAPLGVIAIAANSFAVTAEALCYMPGYGIADAATTLVGQSYGAGRHRLARQFGYLTVGAGMAVMTLMGILMWVFAPEVMHLITPDRAIASAGTGALRIEAWAEPMFAASIVAYGAMVGVGDTIVPAIMNFASIWIVRLPAAAILAPIYGLRGVWMAMCVELTFRGIIFLWRLVSGAWLRHGLHNPGSPTGSLPQSEP